MHDLILNKQFEKLSKVYPGRGSAWTRWDMKTNNPTGNAQTDGVTNALYAGGAMGGTVGLWHSLRPSTMRNYYARGANPLNLFGKNVLGRAKPGMVGKALGGLRGAGNVLLRSGLNIGTMGTAGALLLGGAAYAAANKDRPTASRYEARGRSAGPRLQPGSSIWAARAKQGGQA